MEYDFYKEKAVGWIVVAEDPSFEGLFYPEGALPAVAVSRRPRRAAPTHGACKHRSFNDGFLIKHLNDLGL